MTRKDFAGMLLAVLLLIPGIIYFLPDHGFNQLFIKELGYVKSVTAFPYKKGNNHIVIKVSGISTGSYQLRVDSYGADSLNPKHIKKVHTQTILLPAGEIHGTFERDFNLNPDFKKAEITYIPSIPSAKGYLHLKTGIF